LSTTLDKEREDVSLFRFSSRDRWLAVILLLALTLRLVYVLRQDPRAPYRESGGDTQWYLENGYTLVTGNNPTGKHDVSRLPVAPFYLVFIGFWQAVLPPAGAIIAIRVIQALMGAAVVFFGFQFTYRLTDGNRRAGLLAAGVLALSPALILDTAKILTEPVYLFWMMAGLWLYCAGTMPGAQQARRSIPMLALAGIALGLATLTRAILLVFPLGLAVHLMWRRGRAGARQAVVLLGMYSLVVSTWTVYNLVRWDRLVIGSEGMSSFIYVGSRGWEGPTQVDQNLNEDLPGEPGSEPRTQSSFLTAARRVIEADPVGYVKHRASELARAYLQPYGTGDFANNNLQERFRLWITHDRSLGGLADLVGDNAFLPKLVIYVFHFSGLIFGTAGIWLYRRKWMAAPLSGLILYTTLVHLVILVLPRYLFPLYPVFWIFAAAFLVTEWDRRRSVQSAVSGTGD
jgi:4-amino-4-deoxy-L-arabinose transferase-like glycosyltransferase